MFDSSSEFVQIIKLFSQKYSDCRNPTCSISIHKALTGLDSRCGQMKESADISIHKALTGLDISQPHALLWEALFQSTRPSRASTCSFSGSALLSIFQSTRPSRASTGKLLYSPDGNAISIHKALTGLDVVFRAKVFGIKNFNPQGPHGPRRQPRRNMACLPEFQSTRPSRASTSPVDGLRKVVINFNPQGPHGPRPGCIAVCPCVGYFNPQGPHGPRRFQ